MTPKEKAVDLLDRFYNTTPNENWFNPPLGLIRQEYKSWEHAKEVAFICVDEIILSNPQSNPFNTQVYSTMSYWEEVKKEIENI